MRQFTSKEADAAFDVLVRECGQRDSTDDRYSFGYHASRTTEYRFMGALGFGGKFRNNGNRGGVPYVDCYQEDATPEREAMIERANKALVELFGAGGK